MTRQERIAVVMTALVVAFLVYSVYQDQARLENNQLFEDELAALLTQLLIA